MKIYRISGKTWKDKLKAKAVTLYHVSPDRLSALLPRSKFLKTGRTGVFLSPSYKSLILDWASYVKNKKQRFHSQGYTAIDRIHDKMDELKKQEQTYEVQQELIALRQKYDELSTKSAEKEDRQPKGYSTLYIHSIECPMNVYNECKARMDIAYENDPVKSYGFWGWGAQIFIDAEFLPQLKIFNVKPINLTQFMDEYDSMVKNRYKKERMKLTPEEMQEWEKRRIEKEEAKKLEEQKMQEREKLRPGITTMEF